MANSQDDLINNKIDKNNNEIITYGCRLNSYESQLIKDNAKLANLKDTAIFNTCAVTAEAENEAIKSIINYKKKHPNKKIIVTGCAAQIDSKKFAKMKEVDLVLGNEAKLKHENYKVISEINTENLERSEGSDYLDGSVSDVLDLKKKIITSNIFKSTSVGSNLITTLEGKTRGFIQIQNGCNHFCSFCIIPKGRGKNRAVPINQIIDQIKILMENGYKEFVFTGVDITDYGKDINSSLAGLIKKVLEETKLERLRLSSVDVAEVDSELFELLAFEERILPNFHISIQSGDDVILDKMKRRHKRQDVINFCNNLRDKRQKVSFGADIIVGFPSETEENFKNTCDIVHQAGLQFLHVFPYSIRPQTPAAKMDGQISDIIKKNRSNILRDIGNNARIEFYKKMDKETDLVLIENGFKGKTTNFCNIELHNKESQNLENRIVKMQIKFDNGKLFGSAI